jgi:anti-sigma factor RsiW
MTACHDVEPLLLERAAGALDAPGLARLSAHLLDCAACRAEGEALEETLALVRLPPVAEAERQALVGLADAMAGARAAAGARRAGRLRLIAAVAVAAAVALVISAPAFTRRAPSLGAQDAAAALAAGAAPDWQAPDPDELYALADQGLEPSAGESDAVLAAAEGWAELVPDTQ